MDNGLVAEGLIYLLPIVLFAFVNNALRPDFLQERVHVVPTDVRDRDWFQNPRRLYVARELDLAPEGGIPNLPLTRS
jgi:hypothetical protein